MTTGSDETSVNTDKIATRLHDQCFDWNGASLADNEETRNSICCGELRVILAERGKMRANLRHWREEVGKLHSRCDRLERTVAARDRRIKRLVEALEYARAQGGVFPADSEPPLVLSGEGQSTEGDRTNLNGGRDEP